MDGGGKAGPVARLLRGCDDEVWVQFGALGIFFDRGDDDLLLESPDSEDHPADIRLEAWDAPPPDPGAPWLPVEDTTVEGGTGFVVVGPADDEASRQLIIGPPHFLYGPCRAGAHHRDLEPGRRHLHR